MTGGLFGQVGGEVAETVATPLVSWAALVPLIILAGGGLLLLTVASLAKGRLGPTFFTAWTVVLGMAAFVTSLPLWARVQGWSDGLWWWDPAELPSGPYSTLGGAVGVDGFSVAVTMLVSLSLVVCALVLHGYQEREGERRVEAHVLVIMASVGALVMAVANDLIVLFLGLETLSVAAYVLAAINLRRVQSQEGALKYFVLGAFSSAFFLYGIALIYGGTGSTSLIDIKDFLAGHLLIGTSSALVLLGLAMLLAGFAFKIAAVPFHSWSPDVYDGSPSPVVAFMASVVKVAAFAGMVRVLVVGFETFSADWRPIVQAIAVLSLVGGALWAIVQSNVKRMLAYSSISHAGFILLGIEAASTQGTRAVFVYLVAYSFMVIGSFAVVTVVGRTGDGDHSLSAYNGLGRSAPLLAATFTFLLLAQAGIPFTSGFYAKFYAIIAAVDGGSTWLAIVAMLSAVLAAYLYLRLVVAMWFVAPEEGTAPLRTPRLIGAALAVCAAVTLVVGVLPDSLTRIADEAEPVLVHAHEPGQTAPPGGLDLDDLFGGQPAPQP